MAPRSKTILYVIVAVVILWLGGCIVKRERPAYAKWKLKRQLAKIEPWTASTNYSAAGWNQLIEAAKAFQKADAALAGDALGEHFGRYAAKPEQLSVEQGKAFLLLRVVFDLPEHGPPDKRFSFAEWVRAQTDMNPDGTMNLAWPLSWEDGGPRLIAGREGSGGSYSVRDEYVFLRYQFAFRDLARVRLDARP